VNTNYFSEKQIEVLKFGYEQYDGVICDGAIRSGKTAVVSIGFILWAMNNFKNKNFIIASQSVSSCKRNVIQPLLSIKYLHQQYEIKYKTAQNLLVIARGKTLNYFYIFGGKDESSYQQVQGITAAGAYLDEVVLMPESFVNQVLARCSVPKSKFWFSCNPEGPMHWFKRNYIDKHIEKNLKYIHFTIDDNPSLSDKIKQRYRDMYTGVFYDRYILGKWTKAEGLIYNMYVNNEESYMIDKVPEDMILINVGMDFGGTKAKNAIVVSGFSPFMKKLYVLEAKRFEEDLSPEQLDKAFVDFCQMVFKKYGKTFNTRADSAEPILIRGLKNAALANGLRTTVKYSLKKPIKSRIDTETKLFGQHRIFLMRDTTKDLQLALKTAAWNPKKEDQRLDDGSTDIDIIDAFEYSFEEYMNNLIDGERFQW